MAKHMISVCIFCFLCATHTPCSSHAEVTHKNLRLVHSDGTNLSNPLSLKDRDRERLKVNERSAIVVDERDGLINKTVADDDVVSDVQTTNVDKLTEESIVRLFQHFGDGKTMNLEDFQRFLSHVDLTKNVNNADEDFNETKTNLCLRRNKDLETTSSTTMSRGNRRITSTKETVNNATKKHVTVDKSHFVRICPHVLYKMLLNSCNEEKLTNVEEEQLVNVAEEIEDRVERISSSHLHLSKHTISKEYDDNVTSVWLFSNLAVIVISACGVLGLAVIPIMQKRFYQPLLQFLVALAVGTLSGDALLHLLPHAMDSSHRHHHVVHRAHHQSPLLRHAEDDGHLTIGRHEEDDEDINMWKGLVAMLGLLFFFLMERIIMMASNWRKKKQMKYKLPSRLKVMKPDGMTTQPNTGERQCKHKYSSFPMCYEEITMLEAPNETNVYRLSDNNVQTNEDVELHNNTATTTTLDDLDVNSDTNSLKIINDTNKNDVDCRKIDENRQLLKHQKQQLLHGQQQLQNHLHNQQDHLHLQEKLPQISSCDGDGVTGDGTLIEDGRVDIDDSLEYTVILREHENRHHGHSHTHGHVHAAPKTMSSVAWMVVMGDGLHNFTDGMAIGAAFASGIAGGLSTTVAVFCHELPHELGDFAMLLKAGMTVKQALFYNLLSSLLCLLGNIFGVLLGNTEYASGWIFALAAGMFLYIALVDMIPELTSGHDDNDRNGGTLFQLFLHVTGLTSGLAIMTVIALYEHDLKHIFNDTV